MGSARIAAARARVRAGVLAATALVVFLAALITAGLAEWTSTAPQQALAAELSRLDGQAGAVRWQTRLADDADAQAAAAAAVLDREFETRGAAWERSVASDPVATGASTPDAPGADAPALVLLADPAVPQRAELVAGAWPDDPASGALQADAADRLGITVGDVLVVGDTAVAVAGLWRATDPTDPAWFGDPLAAAGTAGTTVGPLLVDESVIADLPAAVFARWTATVDADPADAQPTDADRLDALRAAIPRVGPALLDDPAMGGTGLTESGGLAATIDDLLAAAAAARAIAPLPLALAAIAALVALLRLGGLLAEARRGETVLLRARGASARGLAGSAAIEAVVVAVPTAALGAALAGWALGLVSPSATPGGAPAWVAAVVVAVAAVTILAAVAWRAATRPIVRGAGDEPGRVARGGAIGGTVLVVALAAVAAWRLASLGSPLAATRDGIAVDPLAALAPALILVAAALAVLALAGPAGRALERLAARSRGLSPSLPLRRLARRPALYAGAALSTMIGIGALTLTAALLATWQATDLRAAAVATGGDVRVQLSGRALVTGPDDLALAPPFLDQDGVNADGPALRAEVRIGSDPHELVAVGADALGDDDRAVIALDAGADSDGAPGGYPVPTDSQRLSVDLVVTAPPGTPGTVTATAVLLGPQGAATALDLGTVAIASGAATVEADLPGAPNLALLGVELRAAGTQGLGDPQVRVANLRFDGAPSANELAGEVVLSARSPSGRVAVPEADGPLPVILDSALAAAIDAEPGDPLDFRIVEGSAEIDAVVAGVAPELPGDGDLLARLGALEAAAFASGGGVPQHGERWLATTAAGAVAEHLERAQPLPLSASTRADASTAGLVGPALGALAWGAAGAAAFAIAAFAALAAAIGRSRRAEPAVLRALGVPAREQGLDRFAELGWAAATAVLAGVGVGALTAAFVVPAFVRAAVPGAAALEFHPGPAVLLGWTAAVAALVVASLVIAWRSAASAARAARSATRHGEEAT